MKIQCRHYLFNQTLQVAKYYPKVDSLFAPDAAAVTYLGPVNDHPYHSYMVFSLSEHYDSLIYTTHCLSLNVYYTGNLSVHLTKDILIGTPVTLFVSTNSTEEWTPISMELDPDIIINLEKRVKLVIEAHQTGHRYAELGAAVKDIVLQEGQCVNGVQGRVYSLLPITYL